MDANAMNEQVRMLKEYEDQQAALNASREAEQRRQQEEQARLQAEFERRQAEQAAAQQQAQEQLMMQQQQMYHSQAAQQVAELERAMLEMRGQYERDQIFLEQYDRVCQLSFLCQLPLILFSVSKLWKPSCRVLAHILIRRWRPRTI